jgi:hypothetical protein
MRRGLQLAKGAGSVVSKFVRAGWMKSLERPIRLVACIAGKHDDLLMHRKPRFSMHVRPLMFRKGGF